MLGDDCERVYEELVNTLGNLTLAAYNSELSDAPFAEKKAHLKGGFDQDYLVISKELHDLDMWDESAIRERAERLAERALEVWPFPELSADVVASYKPIKKAAPTMKSMTFRAVCTMAKIVPGIELVASEGGPCRCCHGDRRLRHSPLQRGCLGEPFPCGGADEGARDRKANLHQRVEVLERGGKPARPSMTYE